jgi:transcriptional regulator with XRE-family HTH domain
MTGDAMPATRFGTYIRTLRKRRGLTLKEVEQAAKVSNAYVSQFERGLRNPPHPDILNRLAKVYEVPVKELLIEAGFLKEESDAQRRREQTDAAYNLILSDPTFQYGTRLKGSQVTFEVKRFIVEMYEKTTGHKLFEDAQ